MQTTTRQLTVADAQALRAISIETFQDTFGAQNSAENMTAYLASAYNLPKLQAELATVGTRFYFVERAHEPLGYLKLNVGDTQSEAMGADALEIERIYIRPAYKGRGLGSAFIKQALTLARAAGKTQVWLGVWEHNEPAKAFDAKWGFTQFSAHQFVMGDDPQIDLLLVKKLD